MILCFGPVDKGQWPPFRSGFSQHLLELGPQHQPNRHIVHDWYSQLGQVARRAAIDLDLARPCLLTAGVAHDDVLFDLPIVPAGVALANGHSYVITTANDDLAQQLEPGAPPPSARFRAMATLAERGIPTGVLLMPVLPFLEDSPENITDIVTRAHACGASHVVPAFGMTLRDRQRSPYYAQLDRRFPGMREKYERAFGERYFAPATGTARLEALFDDLAARYGLQRSVAPYRPAEGKQLTLF